MKTKGRIYGFLMMLPILLLLVSCGGGNEQKASTEMNKTVKNDAKDPMQNKGIGPVKSVTLGEFNQEMADEGQALYQLKCVSCHKPTEKFVGPAPIGILKRRTPEWIMNMILNPEEMLKNDPIAKQLLIESNLAPMANQNLTEEEARKILEYFRTLE